MAEIRSLRDQIDKLPPYIDERWAKLIPLADIASWEGRVAPDRQWLLENWLPLQQVTYLTGAGSAGKSLLGQQLATCVALGLPFLGVQTRQARALYLSCEDDTDELWRRQEAICEALHIPIGDVVGRLQLVSLAGHIGSELATFEKPERTELGDVKPLIRPTPRYIALEGMAIAHDVGFIVLDNVAHLFAGNENVRVEVAAFIGLLNRLAIRTAGAVMLIGHPNKSGADYSGSTAWENQVRSRLFMETPKGEDDVVLDPDARVLSRSKANYAPNGETLRFRWHRWAYVREEDLPSDYAAELAETIRCSSENAAFLACLRERISQGEGRTVGPSPGPNYAPSQFEGMVQSKGFRKGALKRAMDRLFALSQIESVEVKNKKSGRSAYVIREVPEASHNAPHNARTTLLPNPAQSPAQPGTTHTLDTTYLRGAAHGQAAPPTDEDE